jgi:beta-mannosidase
LYPQSHMLDFHNKADGHERRIATYLVENFRTKTDLEVCAVRRLPGSWSGTMTKWAAI